MLSSLGSVLEHRSARSRAQFGLVYKLVIVGRRWRARLSERMVGAGHTDATFSALYALASAPSGLNQTELAERMGVTGSSLVRLLDLLETQGQIRREAMVGDRRANLIRLQPAGASAVRELDAVADQLRDEVFEGVSDEGLAQLSDLMDRLLQRLAAVAPDEELDGVQIRTPA
ncbi:MarR family transcriptional regulator, transcriptional regulator for hemolysin [Brevundimonas viscosa]|uniref:MarR family transcriptional regulator, transcriptional regulator for hemolysin n=1 Tax=Brevundimonas viscosa TaxID=871741 RepID=A0A1I6RZF3_9CAUL|nr:MarR family transcriptional regulator, transcriptional regulator for hemolysin [Brevundimonas viscosa]